jgi:hypothetical protein
MKRSLIGLVFVGGLVALGAAMAQTTIVSTTLSGNEVIQVAQGPGGALGLLALNTVRGSGPIDTKSGAGAATSTATPGTLCWVGTAPTTWAVTLPVAPPDGAYVKLCTDTTLTSMVTVTAGAGDTLTTTYASQTLTANASWPTWQYKASTKIWYRTG